MEIKKLLERNKLLEKNNKDIKKEAKDKSEELLKITNEMRVLADENTKLKKEDQYIEDLKIADFQLKEINKDLKEQNEKLKTDIKSLKETMDKLKNTEPEENDNDGIESLVQNKYLGYRRETGSLPQPAPKMPQKTNLLVNGSKEIKCTVCDFTTRKDDVLKEHISMIHKKCDVCPEILSSHTALREHNEQIHGKYKGYMLECGQCKFSAINKMHLKRHIDRHHREPQQHKTKQVKINIMCKNWRSGHCSFQEKCRFEHKIIWCRFERNCRNMNNCKFEHKANHMGTPSLRNVPNIWSERNTSAQTVLNKENFPFLGNPNQQQNQLQQSPRWQIRNQGY